MSRFILAFALLALPSVGFAAAKAPTTFVRPITSTEMLSAVPLNASAATRTITLTTQKNWAKLRVRVAYTYSAATSVTLTPTCSLDGTNYTAPVTRVCTAGSCEAAPHTDIENGTANFDLMWDYDVRGCANFKIVFSGGSPGAGDLITTQASVIVGD